ncbi:hypothetical protein JOQ06_012584 [Pogonophryne albipinna]|uniref:C2H2-type domain-containing protein n=1 Tax=Pogonophryne albipinna TaxID=1090488 RepID=A0AAD6BFL1_9TELE|nr:hypothetical protein JOQ06_012584 [Pogonophryne albipinna]
MGEGWINEILLKGVYKKSITGLMQGSGVDAAGKVLDRWSIMSREEEIITLQQFLRFGETKSIVELMAIQEKEGQAVTVPSSKTDSGIRTFIESNNRSHSPGIVTQLDSSSPTSIHHFENIPNSLAFLLPFQYINPVSAPMLGLPPNGHPMEQSALRLREPSLPNQIEQVETSDSEVSLSPFRSGQSPSRGALGGINNIEPKTEPNASHAAHGINFTQGTCLLQFLCSLRSRNRHSANPNPRLHMPMLRNNRDKDLIRSTSGTPVISSTKNGGFSLTSPGRPPLGFTTPPVDTMLQSPLHSPLVFPSLKSVHPVQPVPPFYRTLLSPADLVSPQVSLPTSPILPTTTNSTTLMDQQQHLLAVAAAAASHNNVHMSDAGSLSHRFNIHHANHDLTTSSSDPTPKKKPHEMSPGLRGMMKQSEDECREGTGSDSRGGNDLQGELRCMGSFTSEDQDHERDFENESETSDSKMFYRDDPIDVEDQQKQSRGGRCLEKDHDDEGSEEAQLRKEMESKGHSSPSPPQPPMRIKEELNDPTYDMFCMGQYGLYNGGMAAAAAAASMAALHESFISSMGYGASPPKFPSSQSPEEDPCSSPDPKICYVCKKTFKSSYSMKLHYKNVHLKEMHVCTVTGCNAAFPSRRSRDRHSSNINLHRKLLTKELDDIVLDPQHPPLPKDLRAEFLAKIYAGHHMGMDPYAGMGIGGGSLRPTGLNHNARSLMSSEYPHHTLNHNLKNHHSNGFSRGQPDDYMVLDLSTTSSVQSSSSVHSSHESDEGSDEGILLDDLEEEEEEGVEDEGVEDEEEGNSEGEDCSQHAEGRAEGRHLDETGELRGEGQGEGLEPTSSPFLFSSSGGTHGGSHGGSGGILCNICHKMYSNKGTLRVHYKTVHLREMHKCKIPGCNMVFSSVRSRNRHSQNPNLHKNMPFSTITD